MKMYCVKYGHIVKDGFNYTSNQIIQADNKEDAEKKARQREKKTEDETVLFLSLYSIN